MCSTDIPEEYILWTKSCQTASFCRGGSIQISPKPKRGGRTPRNERHRRLAAIGGGLEAALWRAKTALPAAGRLLLGDMITCRQFAAMLYKFAGRKGMNASLTSAANKTVLNGKSISMPKSQNFLKSSMCFRNLAFYNTENFEQLCVALRFCVNFWKRENLRYSCKQNQFGI